MEKGLAVFCVPVFLLLAASCLQAAESPLKINAYPDQTSVKAGMMFLVNVQVQNDSEDTVEFWANTCSYEKQWVMDQAGVFSQAWTCEENGLEQIELEPQDIYKKSIILYIPKKDGSGPVTFRLGFKQMEEDGDMVEPVWGEPITMHVIVPGAAASDAGAAVQDAAGSKVPAEPPAETRNASSPTYQDPAVPLRVHPGEEFSISAVSNPSTGYSWKMTFPKEEKGLELLDSKHVVSGEAMPGVPGKQVYTFKALKTGETKIDLVYQRPWAPSSADTRKVFTVLVQES